MPQTRAGALELATPPAFAHLPFPAEIRDRIYKFVLVFEEFQKLDTGKEYKDTRKEYGAHPNQVDDLIVGSDTGCLSLLLVSKQTYLEAYHIFYQYNPLDFGNLYSLWLFLKNIGFARRLCVDHISFSWYGSETKEAFQLLRRCANLRRIDIHVPNNSWCGEKLQGHSYGEEFLREVRGLEAVNFLGMQELCVEYELRTRRLNTAPRTVILMQKVWAKIVSDVEALRRDMMRPRLKRYASKADEKVDLLQSKRAHSEAEGKMVGRG